MELPTEDTGGGGEVELRLLTESLLVGDSSPPMIRLLVDKAVARVANEDLLEEISPLPLRLLPEKEVLVSDGR